MFNIEKKNSIVDFQLVNVSWEVAYELVFKCLEDLAIENICYHFE